MAINPIINDLINKFLPLLEPFFSKETLFTIQEFLKSDAFFVTMAYPALISIIAGIILFILVTKQRAIYNFSAPFIDATIWFSKYIKNRRNNAMVIGIIDSMKKPEPINKNKIYDLFGSVIFGIIIISILTKTLFLAVVTTQSMAPLIMPGDLVLTQAYTKNISVGDVIVFIPGSGDKMVVHRVLSIAEDGIRTKGDNANPDSWRLTQDNIKGKTISINHNPLVIRGLGYYFMPVNNPMSAQDPALRATQGGIRAMQQFGPVFAILIMVFVLFTSGKK